MHPRTGCGRESVLWNGHGRRPSIVAKIPFKKPAQIFCRSQAFCDGKSGGPAPGHQGCHRSVAGKEFLIKFQDGIFFKRWKFQGIVKMRRRFREGSGAQEGGQGCCPPRLAFQRRGKPRQVLVGPGCGNAKARVKKKKCPARKGWKRSQRLYGLTTPGGQSWLVLQEKIYVGTERGRQVPNLAGA